MIQELVYTSAPQGLLRGSSGFCTVAATPGMSPILLQKLESLSGYRHVFPPSDARADRNPINWSHFRISVGEKSYHVLSRVGFAGRDYTDRTNHIAHHLVLDPADGLPEGGPAWLLGQPGCLRTRWDGDVRHLTQRRDLPRGDSRARVCSAWAEAMGDAGWAGQVADWFLQNPSEPVYLLFEPGRDADLLPLFCEALTLVPTSRRWEVTFATYSFAAQTLPCVWRGLATGSPEAQKVSATRQGRVLRLHGTAPSQPPMSKLVAAARTGQEPSGFDSYPQGSLVAPQIEEERSPSDEWPSEPATPERQTRIRPPELPQSSSNYMADSMRSDDRASENEPALAWPISARKRPLKPATVALPAIVAGILVGLGLAWLYSDLKEPPMLPRQAPLADATSGGQQKETDSEKHLDEEHLKSLEQAKKLRESNHELRTRVTSLQAANQQLSNRYKSLKQDQKRPADLVAANASKKTAQREKGPLEAEHGFEPTLPADRENSNSEPLKVVKNYCILPHGNLEKDSDLQLDPKLDLDDFHRYELELIHPQLPLTGYEVPSDSAKQVDSLDVAIKGVETKPIQVATFVLRERRLMFRWRGLESLTNDQKQLIRRWLRDSVLSVKESVSDSRANPLPLYIGLKRQNQPSENLKIFQKEAPTRVSLTWSKEDQPLPQTRLFVGSVKCQRVTGSEG
jgi:hypothetical protein